MDKIPRGIQRNFYGAGGLKRIFWGNAQPGSFAAYELPLTYR